MDPVSVFNALHDAKILKFGRYQLKSGLVAPYYMNLRRLPLYPKLMLAIADQVIDKFLAEIQPNDKRKTSASVADTLTADRPDSDRDSQLEDSENSLGSSEEEEQTSNRSSPFIICGVPYGAIPLASLIASKAKLPYLFERKEAKSYGDQQSLLDGFDSGKKQRVILIEDVICSGKSILDAIEKLEKQNLTVEYVICIVDREENGINLLMKEHGIRVLSLYKISAILRILETTNRISHAQFTETTQWISDNQFVNIGLDPSEKKKPADNTDGANNKITTTTSVSPRICTKEVA